MVIKETLLIYLIILKVKYVFLIMDHDLEENICVLTEKICLKNNSLQCKNEYFLCGSKYCAKKKKSCEYFLLNYWKNNKTFIDLKIISKCYFDSKISNDELNLSTSLKTDHRLNSNLTSYSFGSNNKYYILFFIFLFYLYF